MTNILVNDNACNILGCCNLLILHVVFVIFYCVREKKRRTMKMMRKKMQGGWFPMVTCLRERAVRMMKM